jgi:hypothetical protein
MKLIYHTINRIPTFHQNRFKNRKGRVALKIYQGWRLLSIDDNIKCKWKKFLKVGESQPRGVRGVDNTIRCICTIYAKHAGKKTKFNSM